MAKTVVGLFDTRSQAETVVQELVASGFAQNHVSLVANNATGDYNDVTGDSNAHDGDDDSEHKTASGAGTGAVGGTVVGGVLGLLVGIGALAIPGVGPVIAAGQLATVLGSAALGAGIGAAAGGLIGALVNLGVPEDDATYYNEGVRRGGTLITVEAEDDTAQKAYDILQTNGAADISQRSSEWKNSGWQHDPNAEAYSPEQIQAVRSTSTGTAVASGSTTTDQAAQVSSAMASSARTGIYSKVAKVEGEEKGDKLV